MGCTIDFDQSIFETRRARYKLQGCVLGTNIGINTNQIKLQSVAVYDLSSAGYDGNLNDLFQAIGRRKLCHQRLDKKSIMMYKTLNGMTPNYLRSRLVFHDIVNSYHLRNAENTPNLPQPRTVELSCEMVYL